MTDFDADDFSTDFDSDDDVDSEEFSLDMDMTGVERVSFTPAPEGEYDLLVEDMKIHRAENKNLSIATVFSIANDEDNDGKKIFHYTLVGGPSWDKIKSDPKKLKTAKGYIKNLVDAVTGTKVDGNISFNSEFFDSVVGNECRAYVKVQVDKTGKYDDKNAIARFLFND